MWRFWVGAAAVLVLATVVVGLPGSDGDDGDGGARGAGDIERVEAEKAPSGERRGPEIVATRVVSKDGHPSHPTWYHVSQIVERDGLVTVAYNRDSTVFAAQLRADDLEIVRKEQLNEAKLGGRKDTTLYRREI